MARAVLATVLLGHAHCVIAALSFTRGTLTSIPGVVDIANTVDSRTLTVALTGPGIVDSSLSIPETRIQYDMINTSTPGSDTGLFLYSWNFAYSPSLGPDIIGASTPTGYIDSSGTAVPVGGMPYTTLFNAGYGVYNYNTGAPWTIDYEANYLAFDLNASVFLLGIQPQAGVGDLSPTSFLPTFDIEFSPSLAVGTVPVSSTFATDSTLFENLPGGTVLGPVVPEPASMGMLAATAVATLARRRRRSLRRGCPPSADGPEIG
jgi:hypothetical protein